MNNSEVLIYAQKNRLGELENISFELTTAGRKLANQLGDVHLSVVVIGNISDADRTLLSTYGADKIYTLLNDKLTEYSLDYYSFAIETLIKEIQPQIVLFGATNQGRELAPFIAGTLKTGLTADCTALEINENGMLAATRPTFGGELMATILCKTKPQMATVRPSVLPKIKLETPIQTEIIEKHINLDNVLNRTELIEFKELVQSSSIEDAKIIIAGGMGMKNSQGFNDGFNLLNKLADNIGGKVGGSRPVVELGVLEHSCQVGQTGKTVSPDIYIACGISGALQHTVGMKNSKKIIAINKDKNAPIFEIADIGIVGDVFEILPELIKITAEEK